MAQLRHLGQYYADELVIISIHSGKFPSEKSTDNIREAVMRHGIDHPVVNDADFEIWQQYTVRAWPTLVLINPQGKIVDTQSGEILVEEYVPKIEALIKEFDGQGLDRTPLNLRPERMVEPMRPLSYPSKLLLGPDRTLFIADTGHHRILQVQLSDDNLSGEIIQQFGSGESGLQDGPASEAKLHDPHGMALNGKTLYVADTENHAIRAINLDDGNVRTVAGTGRKAHGYLEQGGPTQVSLRSPWAVWAEGSILLIAMAGSHQIWALVDEARLGIFAGSGQEALVDGSLLEASFNQPSDIDAGFGYMFIADSEASAIRAISMGENPQVMTLIGQGLFEFGDVDGIGGSVRLQHPTGLTFHKGLIYIADSYNHKIKTLDPTTAEVKTLISSGQSGYADGLFEEAELFEPEGVVADGDVLFIADTNNHLIRVADLKQKTVRTLMLKGLEKLTSAQISQRPEERLNSLVVDSGQVEIELKIVLPDNYKLNDEAVNLLRYANNGEQIEQTFTTSDTPKITLNLDSDHELSLDLTLYYCETKDQRLCMIHNARVIIPLTVSEVGKDKAQVEYVVSV